MDGTAKEVAWPATKMNSVPIGTWPYWYAGVIEIIVGVLVFIVLFSRPPRSVPLNATRTGDAPAEPTARTGASFGYATGWADTNPTDRGSSSRVFLEPPAAEPQRGLPVMRVWFCAR
jgi:hypothetical protein